MGKDLDTSLEGGLPMGHIQQYRLQMIQSIAEEALRWIAMVFHSRPAFVFHAPLTHQMAPDKCQSEQADQFADSLRPRQMSRLQVEASRLQGREERLDLPTPPIERERLFGRDGRSKDQVLIFSEPLADYVCANGPDPTPPEQAPLTDRKRTKEQLRRQRRSVRSAKGKAAALAQPDRKRNVSVGQKGEPRFADKLAVTGYNPDIRSVNQSEEPLEKRDAVFGAGRPFPANRLPDDWKRDPLVGDPDHQDIDWRLSEVPLGAINTDDIVGLLGQKPKQKTPEDLEIKLKIGHKSLDSPIVGGRLDCRLQGQSEFGEVGRGQLQKGGRESGDKLQPSLVPGQMSGENVGQVLYVRHGERVGLRRRIAIGLTIPTARA